MPPSVSTNAIQDYEVLEFFAGRGNLTRCMRASGRSTASFDILYGDRFNSKKSRQKPYGSNCMDVNSASGFAFCVCT